MNRIFLSEIGYSKKSTEELITEAKAYIDDVYNAGIFNEQNPRSAWKISNTDSYNLAFHGRDTPEFTEIRDHINAKMNEAFESQRPRWAEELLKTMVNDSSDFLQQVCITNYGSSKFVREPILYHLDPDTFVDNAISLSPEDQDRVFLSLKCRFEHGEIDNYLQEEKEWFVAVRQSLLDRAANSTPIKAHKYELLDKWYFAPILDIAPN